MKISPTLKAMAVVIAFTIFMGLIWARYSEFLMQGQEAPDYAVKLNNIEKSGVPDFSLKTLSGEEINLKQFAGKVLILNFWASWCDPCIAEFPSLLKLIEKFKGKVILLAVSADYEEQDIHAFLKTFKVSSPNIFVSWDKDYKLASVFGTSKLPESYVIGKDGRLIRKIAGVDDWATEDAFAFFEMLTK